MVAEQNVTVRNSDDILKKTLLLFMIKITKVGITIVVRQQFTNHIQVSRLVLGTPSDLISDTPVFLPRYKVKCFFHTLCPKSVFFNCSLWLFGWFYWWALLV